MTFFTILFANIIILVLFVAYLNGVTKLRKAAIQIPANSIWTRKRPANIQDAEIGMNLVHVKHHSLDINGNVLVHCELYWRPTSMSVAQYVKRIEENKGVPATYELSHFLKEFEIPTSTLKDLP